jgi:hypothetical protein
MGPSVSGSNSDPLSTEFEVVLNGETYVFRKPTIRFRIELGYRTADIRRRAFPSGNGAMSITGEFFLDRDAADFARACGILELYLIKSNQTWPFSNSDDGKPVVDFDKFPPDREDTVWELAAKFDTEVSRFRKRGNPDKPPAGDETVDSQ